MAPSFTKETRSAWVVLIGLLVVGPLSALLLQNTLAARYERDVSRMVFNDNTQVLSDLRRQVGLERDSLQRVLAARPGPAEGQAYIVVSIEEHQLWYRRGDSILFTAPVTTGSGKVLEIVGGSRHWKFETPRGRLNVVSKETDPVWIAPDWHYVELAQSRGLGVLRLSRGQRLKMSDGGALTVVGSDIIRMDSRGQRQPIQPGEGRELVADGNLIIPPYGTNQRKYPDLLGTHRLNLGDGYAIHGTNKPEQIGRSVSHGCVRLRNEDIAALYEMVEVGTPVFIY